MGKRYTQVQGKLSELRYLPKHNVIESPFIILFYQIKSPETFHVYSQKGISFITLISGKIMFT